LAEPHFGATWPFLVYKKNYPEIIDNKNYYIFFPLMIVASSIFLFFYSPAIFYFIFLVANMFHVTRQSTGISKLYVSDLKERNFQTIAIYLFGILFFLIGILRFYGPIENINLSFVGLIILLVMMWYIKTFKYSANLLVMLTGILIFFPMCFVEKPIHAIIMGVTMHYTQYLYLTYKIFDNREKNDGEKKSNFNAYIITVIFYGVIMSILSMSGKNVELKNLILIPIIGQFLHFYIDSLLWKFSNEHHRNVTLKFLK
jgi:hypothetical protein